MKYILLSTILFILACSKSSTSIHQESLNLLEEVQYWKVDSAYSSSIGHWEYPQSDNDRFQIRFSQGNYTVRWKNAEDETKPYRVDNGKLIIGNRTPTDETFTLIEKLSNSQLIWRETMKNQQNKVDTLWYHFSPSNESSWNNLR